MNCAITAGYHFPIVWKSMQSGYSPAEIADVVDTWVLVHWARIVLGYLTFYFALQATLRGRAAS